MAPTGFSPRRAAGPERAAPPRWLRWALCAAVPLLVLLHLAEVRSLWHTVGSDYVLFYDSAQRFVRAPLALYPPTRSRR